MKLTLFESNLIKKIRFEIIRLSKKLKNIEDDICKFYKVSNEFEKEYQKRLGDISKAIVKLRAQLGIEEQNEMPKQAVTVTTYLAEPEYKLLKKAYRQAAKLCHPDYLPKEHKHIGLNIFDKLNKSYHLQDLVTVEHILWLLESGQAFSKKIIPIKNQKLLFKRHKLLKYMIEQKKDQLSTLLIKEQYDISNKDNWNMLFYEYQTQLEDELAILKSKAREKNET